MLRFIFVGCVLLQLCSVNSQTIIHQSTILTDCIIDREEFNSIDNYLDIEKIKELDEEHETTSQDDIDNYKVVISLNDSDRVGKFTVYGGDSVERHSLVIIEVEDISENSKRYLIRDESAQNDDDGFYLITSEDSSSSASSMVMYMESEVKNDDKWRTVVIFEDVLSARLK